MILRVREAGVPGSLCRTRPVSPLPPTGQYLHLLVAPPVATNAAALNAMVAGFTGVVPNTPPGVSVNIVTASLAPQANGLQLHLFGALFLGSTYTFLFDYTLTLTLVPINGSDTNSVLTVQAPPAGA